MLGTLAILLGCMVLIALLASAIGRMLRSRQHAVVEYTYSYPDYEESTQVSFPYPQHYRPKIYRCHKTRRNRYTRRRRFHTR